MALENKNIATEAIFYTTFDIVENDQIEIVGEEARHILQARRIEQDETFFLTNGRGVLAQATVIHTSKKQQMTARINQLVEVEYPATEIVLASAIAKGERQSDYLAMATQLGMNVYIPLLCERSIVKYQTRMESRWQRIIAESSKQCRQCFFPTIGSQKSLSSLLSNRNDNELLIVAQADGHRMDCLQETINQQYPSRLDKITVLVGPEGGFSNQENRLLNQEGILKLCLSAHVLRIETAVVSILTAVNQIMMNRNRSN